MKLTLTRTKCLDNATLGVLRVDGAYIATTLEDKVREVEGKAVEEWKVKGQTAIPKGTYKVIIDYSNRFKKELPLLLDVPGFVGVRIHSGNTAADTEGCILVGEPNPHREDFILNSRITMSKLMHRLEEAYVRNDNITIEIK